MVAWSIALDILTPSAGLSIQGIFSAFDTLIFLWLCASLPMDEHRSRLVLRALAIAATLSVAVGAVLRVLGIHRLFDVEFYSHVARLQGASIPSHLALMCVTGALATLVITAREGPSAFTRITAIANLFICAETVTRGSVLITVAITVCTVVVELRRAGRIGRLAILYLCAGAGVELGAEFLPGLVDRTLYGSPTGGFNSSGRLQNWHVYWHIFSQHPLGGVGLGWLTDLSSSVQLIGNYNVPHNEYLRMLDEGGVLGTVVILAAIGIGIRQLLRQVAEPDRRLVVVAFVALAVMSIFANTLSTPQFSIGFGLVLAALAPTPDVKRTSLR
jgi:teichuronic acid biosynthesis protein TuaE